MAYTTGMATPNQADKHHVEMPPGLAYMSCDTVAECLSYKKHLPAGHDWMDLYRKLWAVLNTATDISPMGGDGTNGTVECKGDQLGDYDDMAPKWWQSLTAVEATAIAAAYTEEYGD